MFHAFRDKAHFIKRLNLFYQECVGVFENRTKAIGIDIHPMSVWPDFEFQLVSFHIYRLGTSVIERYK